LAQVIGDAAQLLRAGLPASIELVLAIDAPDAVVMADSTELHQVVMNLGTNAAYAMRDRGGRLTFGLVADGAADSVILKVGDTGAGMTPEVSERACEPFFTTKPAGEGTGLGLATVHAIVATLDGRLTIDSVPGEGTVVSITLPSLRGELPADMLAEGPGAEAPSLEAAPLCARLLVVDDEPLVLKLCATVLTRLGYEVTALGDPRAAATYVVAHASEIDLLLTDKTMPGFSGLELASIARTANPALPVVLATGFLDDAARLEAADVGITTVIAKPYRAADLAEAVRDALASRAID
jgi:CheY-like chemotaxis protein